MKIGRNLPLTVELKLTGHINRKIVSETAAGEPSLLADPWHPGYSLLARLLGGTSEEEEEEEESEAAMVCCSVAIVSFSAAISCWRGAKMRASRLMRAACGSASA